MLLNHCNNRDMFFKKLFQVLVCTLIFLAMIDLIKRGSAVQISYFYAFISFMSGMICMYFIQKKN